MAGIYHFLCLETTLTDAPLKLEDTSVLVSGNLGELFDKDGTVLDVSLLDEKDDDDVLDDFAESTLDQMLLIQSLLDSDEEEVS